MSFGKSSQTANPHQSGYRWVIMALAASAFLMAFVSRFAWPPLMPVAMADLGIGDRSQALAYMSAFYIGYIITQIPGGVLTDRFGPRLVLAAALMLQGLATLGLAFAGNYQAGFLLRIICGLGGGCVYSACFKTVVAWFSPAERGLAFAVVMSAPTVGIAVPNFLMPLLEAEAGWRQSFFIVGLSIIILAAALLFLMKEVKTTPRRGTASPQSSGGSNVSAGSDLDSSLTRSAPRTNFMVGIKYVFSNRNVLLIALAGFTGLWAQIGFGSMGNDYLVATFGINLKSAGGIMVGYGLVGLAASLGSGWVSGRFSRHKTRLLAVSHILIAVFLIIFGQLSSTGPALAGACLIGATVAFANTLYSIVIADNTSPEWTATAAGISNTIFQVGSLLSPLALGLAYDMTQSYRLTWPILAGVVALGAVAAIAVRRGEYGALPQTPQRGSAPLNPSETSPSD